MKNYIKKIEDRYNVLANAEAVKAEYEKMEGVTIENLSGLLEHLALFTKKESVLLCLISQYGNEVRSSLLQKKAIEISGSKKKNGQAQEPLAKFMSEGIVVKQKEKGRRRYFNFNLDAYEKFKKLQVGEQEHVKE